MLCHKIALSNLLAGIVYGGMALGASCAAKPETIREIPLVNRKVILFQRFKNHSAASVRAELEGMERMFPSLILSDFTKLGLFRPVADGDREKAMEEIARQRSGLFADTDIRIGRLVGAHFLLAGDFGELRGAMSLTARVVNVETGETIISADGIAPAENILVPPEHSLVKTVSIRLLSHFAPDLSSKEVRIVQSTVETRKIQAAVKNYKGEIILEDIARRKAVAKAKGGDLEETDVRMKRKEAEAAFREAKQIDPSYERAKRNLSRLINLMPPSF